MIALLCAVSAEAVCFSTRLNGAARSRFNNLHLWEGQVSGRRVLVVQTGMGRRNAESGAAYVLHNFPVAGLVAYGFAGALVPDLRVGDLLIARRLIASPENEGPEALVCPEDGWAEHALDLAQDDGLPAFSGTLVTSSRLIGDPAEKQAFARAYSAQVVDMESYWIARAAAERGLPFLGIRVISDTAGERLPPFDLWNGKGGGWKTLQHFAAHPVDLRAVVRLGFQVRRAQYNLRRILEIVVAQTA